MFKAYMSDLPKDVPGSDDGQKETGGGKAAHSPNHSLLPTDSPCVAICSTLYDEICRGCGRTAMEVANWVFLSDDEKRAIWARIRSQGYPRR